MKACESKLNINSTFLLLQNFQSKYCMNGTLIELRKGFLWQRNQKQAKIFTDIYRDFQIFSITMKRNFTKVDKIL